MRLSLLALSLASLIGYARSWVFLRRVTMAPQLSGPVLFGNVRSAERDHSLGLGVSEMKIAGEDAGVDNVEIIPFKPWKKLIIALDSVPEQKQSYLLLPGKGALTQTVSWIALFGALAMIVKRLDFNGSTVATKLWQIVNNSKSRGTIMVILSSMASSCCYIQLALNAFSIGCAGLNSALGPMRPLFLALTAVAQVAIWRQSLEGAFGDAGHRLVSTAGAAALSLLPEILYYYQSARQWWKRTLLASYLQSGGATSRSSPTEFGYTRANVGGMGNLMDSMKKAQEIAKQAEVVNKELQDTVIMGQDPSGSVFATFNGLGVPVGLKIADSIMDQGAEAVSLASTQAMVDAHKKSQEAMMTKMSALYSGAGVPMPPQ